MAADVVALKANRKLFNIVRVYSGALENGADEKSNIECVYLYFKFKKKNPNGNETTSRIES